MKKYHKFSLTEGLIESALADDDDAYCAICFGSLSHGLGYLQRRQHEEKAKIIAISIWYDYKLISAVCGAHKAELNRTDDFSSLSLSEKENATKREMQVVKIRQINNKQTTHCAVAAQTQIKCRTLKINSKCVKIREKRTEKHPKNFFSSRK